MLTPLPLPPHRLQALKTVQDLGWKEQFGELSAEEKDRLSATYVNFLPGVVQVTARVARGGDIQGNRVTAVGVVGCVCV